MVDDARPPRPRRRLTTGSGRPGREDLDRRHHALVRAAGGDAHVVARRPPALRPTDATPPTAGGLDRAAGTPDGRARAPAGAPARTIAVVGPNADDDHTQLGDWAGASGQALSRIHI